MINVSHFKIEITYIKLQIFSFSQKSRHIWQP